MSYLTGLIGGLGKGGADLADTYIKDEMDQAREKRQSDLAMAREQSLLRLQATLKEEGRVAQVGRIDAAVGKIADKAVGDKRSLIDSGISDKSAWTPEQQATVDQSLTNDRAALIADPETQIKAAISTGDIAPKDAATINRDERRLDASERATAAKERQAEMRDATQRYVADLRHEDSQKRLDVLIAKMGAKDAKDKPTEAIKFIDGLRKELADDARDTRTLLKEELASDKYMDEDKKQAIRAKYEPKLADIDRKRTQLEKDFNSLRERVGLPAIASEPTPTPAPKPGSLKASPGMEVDGFVFQGGNPKDKANWIPKQRTGSGKVK